LAEVDSKISEILVGEVEEKCKTQNNSYKKNTEGKWMSLGERLKD